MIKICLKKSLLITLNHPTINLGNLLLNCLPQLEGASHLFLNLSSFIYFFTGIVFQLEEVLSSNPVQFPS